MFPFNYLVNIYTVTVTATICGLIFILYKTKYNYWRSRGINGPTPVPLFGVPLDLFRKCLPEVYMKEAKKYGRIYGGYELMSPQLFVADKDALKQICVKDFHLFPYRRRVDHFPEGLQLMLNFAMDKQWKRLRKIISPTFSSGKIKRMKPLIENCIDNGIQYLNGVAEKREQLNLKQYWQRFTLEVIARCLFAANINSHEDPNHELFEHINIFFPRKGVRQYLLTTLFLNITYMHQIYRILQIETIPTKSLNYMSTVVRDLLKQRRRADSDANDFLQLLMEAEKEREDKSEAPLTEEEIISNCILFFFAGYDSTSNFLQFFCFVMAKHPRIQEKLYNEIRTKFPNRDSITFDEVMKLPYLDAVVNETLRRYPSPVINDRTANVDVRIDNTDIVLPANTVVMIPIYAIHHDPEYYPEPEVFKPERFMGENGENGESVDPYTFLPFGLGPRNCVGARFALIEVKLAIIHTILNFKFEKSELTPEKPEFLKGSQLLFCNEIFVNIVKRQ